MVVFVRADDALAPDTDAVRHFQGRTIGLNHGMPFGPQLRQAGIGIDDGALDTAANIEKLRLHRIDGFALALTAPADLDEVFATRYGGKFVRLDKPLQATNVWLAANKDYHAHHRAQVEAMWGWLGSHGRTRFKELVKTYSKTR